MRTGESKGLAPNTDFVLSDGSTSIIFVSEKVPGAYAIKNMATKEIVATINALNGNVHSPSSFFHRRPKENDGLGIDFAFKGAIYLGIIKEKVYLDAYPVNLDELAKVMFCYGREFDAAKAIPVTDITAPL
jgi:hypothetical protein